jgi:hypothetical protein
MTDDAIDELERSIDDRLIAAGRAIEARRMRERPPPPELVLRVAEAMGDREAEALLSALIAEVFVETRRSFGLARSAGPIELRAVYVDQGAKLARTFAELSVALDRRRNGGRARRLIIEHRVQRGGCLEAKT